GKSALLFYLQSFSCLSLDQINICVVYAFGFSLRMSRHINIDTVCLNSPSAVLGHIHLTIDHNLTAVRDLGGIHRNGVIGGCRHAGGGNAVGPGTAADTAGTVMRDPESTQRFQICV